ncbi:MAG: extracellular solute-binding protein [Limnochordia bacterium]|jgi:multiple sugar transport system substrate-binding protein
MKSSLRKHILFTLALLALVSCSTWAAREELVVWQWEAHSKAAWAQWLDYAKQTFEAKHPEIEVVYQYVPVSPDRFILAASANVMPDVAVVSVAYALDLYTSGLLQPLNEYFERTPDLKRAFLPVTQLFNQRDGVIYGATNSLEATSILYNHQHFFEAGLSVDPLAIESWDDFASVVRKLTRVNSDGSLTRAGYHETMHAESYFPWLYSNNATFFNDQQTKATFNTQEGRQALRFQQELWNITRAASGFSVDFVKGNASMVRMKTAVMHLPGLDELEFGQTSTPMGPAGNKRGSMAWGNMYVIPTGAKRPEMAWEWITHYLDFDNQISQFEIMGMPFSPRRDVYLSSAFRRAAEEHGYMATALDIFQIAGVYPFNQAIPIFSAINPVLRQVYLNELAPDTAIEQMESTVNRLVSR